MIHCAGYIYENYVKTATIKYFLAGFGLLTIISLSSSILADTGKIGSPEEVERGLKLYQNYCQSCHGTEGVGEPPIPLGIRRLDYIGAMPLDETSHAWHHDDDNLVQTILYGNRRSKTRMPVWNGTLSEMQARDLVAYLKTFWSDRILQCQGPKHMSCM